MSRRIPVIFLLVFLAITVACTNKKVSNPLADVGSKQPDKVLYDRAMDAMKHNRFDVARITLQTLINTYPDSEYIARAKLAVADSWYAEGGSASLSQAEIEYKDFITFFPNMPEAAEAQLKIANIHYQEMEKPDRDYTHALRAQEEYRQLIEQFPDSKLVPEAKQRLLEVQEVLAEREFRVGRFYYLRQSYPAAIARLQSVADTYPLYSGADEVLYLLGQSYEAEIEMVRLRKVNEAAKSRMIQQFTQGADAAYSRILTRYPVMPRAEDARLQLEALHLPVPKPTHAAIVQNQLEEESRSQPSAFGKLVGNFSKHPDVTQAAKVGEPTMVNPQETSATDVVQQAARALKGATQEGADAPGSVSVETVGQGAPPENQPAPRSDTPADGSAPDASAAPATAASPGTQAAGTQNSATQNSATQNSGTQAAPAAAQPDPNELKPNVAPDPSELKPNVEDTANPSLPPPAQVNEIQEGAAKSPAAPAAPATDGKPALTPEAQAQQDKEDAAAISTSKRKKKKGLQKLNPF